MHRIFQNFFIPFFLIFSIGNIFINEARSQQLDQPMEMYDFSSDEQYNEALQFFVEVFKTMQKEYYKPVEPRDLKKFIYVFNTRLYPKLKSDQKSKKYIKWRNAAYLVDALKDEEDIFSKLFPPKDAEKYETTVLGKRIDLGIDGELTDKGFLVTWVEVRSDAYEKGLRKEDVIYKIGRKKISNLTEDELQKMLTPLEGEESVLYYFEKGRKKKRKITVVSKVYFKQFAFMVPTGVDSIFCIQIQRFNRMTAEDITGYMSQILDFPGETGLIIDLRGNPGGPPLAAREISAFFLNPEEEFAYFQRRNRPKASLDVPEIPEEYRYSKDMIVLIDEKSGSASELFSGILQGKGRAELIGENSAGQVFLKSMFYLSDGSMVLLVTARGHHSDGKVFSFNGLDPDIRAEEKGDDLILYAAKYLMEKRK